MPYQNDKYIIELRNFTRKLPHYVTTIKRKKIRFSFFRIFARRFNNVPEAIAYLNSNGFPAALGKTIYVKEEGKAKASVLAIYSYHGRHHKRV